MSESNIVMFYGEPKEASCLPNSMAGKTKIGGERMFFRVFASDLIRSRAPREIVYCSHTSHPKMCCERRVQPLEHRNLSPLGNLGEETPNIKNEGCHFRRRRRREIRGRSRRKQGKRMHKPRFEFGLCHDHFKRLAVERYCGTASLICKSAVCIPPIQS